MVCFALMFAVVQLLIGGLIIALSRWKRWGGWWVIWACWCGLLAVNTIGAAVLTKAMPVKAMVQGWALSPTDMAIQTVALVVVFQFVLARIVRPDAQGAAIGRQ